MGVFAQPGHYCAAAKNVINQNYEIVKQTLAWRKARRRGDFPLALPMLLAESTIQWRSEVHPGLNKAWQRLLTASTSMTVPGEDIARLALDEQRNWMDRCWKWNAEIYLRLDDKNTVHRWAITCRHWQEYIKGISQKKQQKDMRSGLHSLETGPSNQECQQRDSIGGSCSSTNAGENTGNREAIKQALVRTLEPLPQNDN